MNSYIPYGRQHITQDDIDAVVETLKSDWITQGPKVPEFEQAVAAKVGAKYAIAVNSGTSALHLSCLALGVRQGDVVWTSPNTFVASANCALYCGASVDFVDIDPLTYNMSVSELKNKLEHANRNGKLPKVVIPVHFAGQPCDMDTIHSLAKKYGFKIIEDASHAVGAQYRDRQVGDCYYSDITVFSFHPVKIITTGEGGMATTNSNELAERLSRLRSHGITRNPEQMTCESHGDWYYQQIELGFNYRMTDIQATLGLSQLKRLDEYIERRHELAHRYNELLADQPVKTPWQHPDSYSAYHLYVIRLQLDQINRTRRQVFESLREAGIGVNLHYIPVHTQPYYQAMGFKQGDLPEAERYYTEAISLPMYPILTDYHQNRTLKCLKSLLCV